MKRLKISEESIHYFIDRTLNDISLDVDGMKESFTFSCGNIMRIVLCPFQY